jgi:hypothetical protein
LIRDTARRASIDETKLYRTEQNLSGRRDRSRESPGAISPVSHPLLFLISTSLTVDLNMKNRTETLENGSLAPYFSLQAANREGTFNLDGLLSEGKLILEFLRGTW